MACSSQGPGRRRAWTRRHREARQLAHDVVAEASQCVHAILHRASPRRSPYGATRCAPRRSTRSSSPRVALGPRPELVGMSHELEHQAPLLEPRRTSAPGAGSRRPHRADPAESGGRHLPIDELDGLGHRFRQGRPPMIASGPPRLPTRRSSSMRLLHRMAAGGSGDVDDFSTFHSPRLGPIGLDVEAAMHPRRIARVRLWGPAR